MGSSFKKGSCVCWSVLKVVGVQSLALDIDLAALHEHKSPTVSVFTHDFL